jgi:phosphoglycerol transferase MdoB-like AlkP superfamily enzyme
MKSFLFLAGLLLPLQIAVEIKSALFHALSTPELLQSLFWHSFSLLSLLFLYKKFLSIFSSKKVKVPLWALFVFPYLLLAGFHWSLHESMSWSLLMKNGEDIFYWESLKVILSNFSWPIVVSLVIALIAVIYGERRWQLISTPLLFKSPLKEDISLTLATLVFVFSSWFNPHQQNEWNQLFYSISDYYKDNSVDISYLDSQKLYPWLKQPKVAKNISNAENKPHVFIVMLESFADNYSGKYRENGRAVTPFLDSLKGHGLYVPHFFSNSVETSKGQFSTLCSVIPAYKKNVFTDHADKDFLCLPEILGQNGYRSLFMKAYHDLRFENTGAFAEKMQFDYVYGMDTRFFPKSWRKTHGFGWGVQDNYFYEKAFAILDSLEQRPENKNMPFLMKTMSVSNHMPFHVPQEQRYIWPKPKNKHQHYINSLHLSDRYLRAYFDELKKRPHLQNSWVIILGDNGNPIGPKNARFRTPLLILGPNEQETKKLALKGKEKKELSYSQLDISPTILDLLNIQTRNHFIGTSIFRKKEEFTPLIQPFHGVHLSAVRFPWRYTLHLQTANEKLVNLMEDPEEKKNVIKNADSELLEKLRKDVHLILWNEELINQNRIYTSNEEIGGDGRFFIRQHYWEQTVDPEFFFYTDTPISTTDSVSIILQRETPFLNSEKTQLRLPLRKGKNTIPINELSGGIYTVKIITQSPKYLEYHSSLFIKDENFELLSHIPFTGKQGWQEAQIDKDVGRGNLEFRGKKYMFGFGTHADSKHHFQVNKEWQHLYLKVSMNESSQCGDGASFMILGDNKVLWRSPQIRWSEEKTILLNISNINRLTLRSVSGKDSRCDHTQWLNPILYKEKLPQKIDWNANSEVSLKYQNEQLFIKVKEVSIYEKKGKKKRKTQWNKGQRLEIKTSGYKEKPIHISLNTPKAKIPFKNKTPGLQKIEYTLYRNDTLTQQGERWIYIPYSSRIDATTLEPRGKQQWGDLKKGKSVTGRAMQVDHQLYMQGWGTHSPSSWTLKIPKYSQSFSALTAIPDYIHCGDGSSFELLIDDSLLISSPVLYPGETFPLKIAIPKSADSLTLRTSENQDSQCDHALWLYPTFEIDNEK